MDLGNAHAVLIDLGAKDKLDAICNAITSIMSDKVEHQKSCLPHVTELNCRYLSMMTLGQGCRL
jgi:hypothetical protein